MPDSEGLLSPAELELIERWLKEKNALKSCPSCGADEHTINQYVMNIASPGITFFPAVLVHCRNCTFTRFFSAKLIGVLDRLADEDDGS